MTRAESIGLLIEPTPECVAACAAARTRDLAIQTIAARGRFVIALSGGSTPRLYHDALSRLPANEIAWSKVQILFSDERAVPPSHPSSNYRMAAETLHSRVPIPKENIHRIEAEHGDHVLAAANYEQSLRALLGEAGVVDLVILGMGEDGHTASLFPGENSGGNLDEATDRRLVIPAIAPSTSPISHRVTFSYRAIRQAEHVIVMITGASKAAILARVFSDDNHELPMQRVIRERTKDTLIILDEKAADLIQGVP